jgi:hypothetical protein
MKESWFADQTLSGPGAIYQPYVWMVLSFHVITVHIDMIYQGCQKLSLRLIYSESNSLFMYGNDKY